MKELRCFCEGKFQDDRNEDAVWVGKHFAVVCDGSTAAGPVNGVAGGIVASRAVVRAVQGLADDARMADFVAAANRCILEDAGGASALTPLPFTAAAVYSRHRRQIWRVGDIALAIDGKVNILPLFPHEIAMYAERIAALDAASMLTQQARDIVSKNITDKFVPHVAKWVNNPGHPYNHGMLNGSPVPEEFGECYPVADTAKRLILASDGALVSPRGQQMPFSIEEMLKNHYAALAEDPECVRAFPYWRRKQDGAVALDDRTWLELDVTLG
ncbi:MAG: hypothetical protein H6922_03225 [Pseudomonadaceae bacterium]|nr:hypothetical protein [Pseudomonadaceae bacterium]